MFKVNHLYQRSITNTDNLNIHAYIMLVLISHNVRNLYSCYIFCTVERRRKIILGMFEMLALKHSFPLPNSIALFMKF